MNQLKNSLSFESDNIHDFEMTVKNQDKNKMDLLSVGQTLPPMGRNDKNLQYRQNTGAINSKNNYENLNVKEP